MGVLGRVKLRLSGDATVPAEDVLNEYITTATDRVNLRIGVISLPDVLQSIVVDVVVKMHRRKYHEGITSEGVSTLSTSFVDDVLAEYAVELSTYKESLKESGKVVMFL